MMDPRDVEAGLKDDFFWFRGKLDLIETLLSEFQDRKDRRILSLGCGTGEETEVLGKFGEVHCIDMDPRALALAPAGVIKTAADATRLPYPDSSFDIAAAFDLLEHVRDDCKAIEEVRRVLRPGGVFIFTVPAFPWLMSGHDRALGHFRRYDKAGLRKLLSGLVRVKLGFWSFFLFPPVAMVRILRRSEPEPRVHATKLPSPLNTLLYYMLKTENLLIKCGIPLPFGTTIYGVYTKPTA